VIEIYGETVKRNPKRRGPLAVPGYGQHTTMKRLIVLGSLVLAMLACAVAVLWLWNTGPKPSARTRFALSESRMVQGPVAPPGAPAVTDVLYEPISPQTAAQINRAVPLQLAGPPARPFRLEMGSQTWDRAATCLTQAIYYEAASEPADGKRAVAQVVLNRMRSPAFRPTGCQFTFTCDGSLRRQPNAKLWESAGAIAKSALLGYVYKPIGHATHYHAEYVVPYWASSMAKVDAIGLHDFYRWPGTWRAATYFSQRYANAEPAVGGARDTLQIIPGAQTIMATSPLEAGSSLTADAGSPGHQIARSNLAEDRVPHSMLTSDHLAKLKDDLNKPVTLSADMKSNNIIAKSSSQVP
jgi:hypothetical protein